MLSFVRAIKEMNNFGFQKCREKFLDSGDTYRGLIWSGTALSAHAVVHNNTVEGTLADEGIQDSMEMQDRLNSHTHGNTHIQTHTHIQNHTYT